MMTETFYLVSILFNMSLFLNKLSLIISYLSHVKKSAASAGDFIAFALIGSLESPPSN